MFEPADSHSNSDRDSFDEELSRAMRDVAIPKGMVDRLRVALSAQEPFVQVGSIKSTGESCELVSADPRGVDEAVRVANRGRKNAASRIFQSAFCVAVGILLVFGVWNWIDGSRGSWNAAVVSHLAGIDVNSIASVRLRHGVATPLGWASISELDLMSVEPHLQIGSRQLPLVSLSFRSDRRSAMVSGFLVAVPKRNWADVVDARSLSDSEIHYINSGAWAVWQEGETVFLVVINGESRGLESLQRLIASSIRNVS